MIFSVILVLVVLMAGGGGRGRGRGKKYATQTAEDSSSSDSEYVPEDPTDKGKGKAPETYTRRTRASSPPRHSTGGPVIHESGSARYERRHKRRAEAEPISSKRQKSYANKACIAERYVNFRELTREVPAFGHLLQRTAIEPIGRVPAKAPFCVELIREFYMHGRVTSDDQETGIYSVESTVRGTRIVITPQTIGELFDIEARTTGFPYTQGNFQISTHWDLVVSAVCKPGVGTNKLFVDSRDLNIEYHLLSLILCYNIVPTIGTKRIRWERLVLLFLLGHPEHARGLNISIPFLMWQRMSAVVSASGARELLPFPLMITRILEAQGVDVSCDKYDYGLGPIDGVTLAKSISTLKSFQQTKGYPSASTSAPAATETGHEERPLERASSSRSCDVATLDSLQIEMRSFKKSVNNRLKKLESGIKKILEILSCRRDDVVSRPGPSTSFPPAPYVEPSTAGDDEGDDDDDADDDDDNDDQE